ncbi:uncharacterized protein HMPREF1541_08557 [Cyphellophora europaea CBS 101466]|uniref:Uncharacterized protein n=1 Tax=Cyphellophora europaea (strain CBS 101466) TaxID=1220924 RepID=W2RIW1_CYPE1|nr:uncharacterized protein HMPREF1541_08557 [Cyphellophora europaea CBS 101466]ETN36280.1 hypothetical protein HMPREF1541_08557 [Cyphellophora europaea CBS 101466]
MGKPPPLPPRNPSTVSVASSESELHPPSYDRHLSPVPTNNSPYGGGFDDPRASSQQSLRPAESATDAQRTLLLVYIHGFLGDETSFRSFPAHVHNILAVTLAETHVVHSKIYPRYRSRKNITFARDDFSKWLIPHESPTTDVILLGHSLGGILAAEVVLLPAKDNPTKFQNRILGQVAFDTPFLGMHPGVVGTGIASLFRPAPDLPKQEDSSADMSPLSTQTSTSGLSDLSLSPSDPNYNPTFFNDIRLANRQGKLERGWYFFNKHWGELTKASKEYVTSHLEFGGCLMDYPGLRRRYDAVRALEDIDEFDLRGKRPRVRFVNYYSASTGRIKEQKEGSKKSSPVPSHNNSTLQLPEDSSSLTPNRSGSPSPRISLEEHRDGEVVHKELDEIAEDMGTDQLTHVDPQQYNSDGDGSIGCGEKSRETESDALTRTSTNISTPRKIDTGKLEDGTDEVNLPSLPPEPISPIAFDPSTCHDPDTLKLRQKEHDRAVKAYERAVKDREKTIRDRQKLIQKREKAALKQQQKEEKERIKRSNTINPEAYDKQLQEEAKAPNPSANYQKDRKFCSLPSKINGRRDPTWVRVYMEGMDEVVAHTSLFFMSEAYSKLVGDTAERVEGWVKQDLTRRAVMEAHYAVD